jgi:hypothetical protein
MPAIPIASAVLSEAVLLPAVLPSAVPAADPQGGGKGVPQTFTSLLGTLIEDPEQSPSGTSALGQASGKKIAHEVDAYLAQMTAAPAQPVTIPVVLRMNFFFPAIPSTKTAGTAVEGSDEDVQADPAVSQVMRLPKLAVSRVVVAHATPQTLQSAPVGDAAPAPIQAVPQLTAPVQLPNDLLPAPAQTTVHDEKQPASVAEPMKSPAADSSTPEFTVSQEVAAPMPHAELAFTAKLTVVTPQNASETEPVPASIRASQAPVAPQVSTDNAVKTEPHTDNQPDSQSDGEAAPVPKQPGPKVKAQADAPTRLAEPVVTHSTSQAETASTAIETVTRPVTPARPTDVPALHQVVDARPDAAALPAVSTAVNSPPLRDLSIRIGDSPSNQVDVKIQERAGEVHVSVLSNNPALTSDLRQQVGELVGKLDNAGYHAETFKPASAVASQQSSNQFEVDHQQDFQRGQQQQQEDARQQFLNRQKRSNQSQWLQQMNGNFGPSAVAGVENQ